MKSVRPADMGDGQYYLEEIGVRLLAVAAAVASVVLPIMALTALGSH